jgi:hypothetical protein
MLKKTKLEETAEMVAGQGTEAFRLWWGSLSKDRRSKLRGFMARYQGMAQEADARSEAHA